MDINKKYIIIFGTLILLLVIITGAITYYKEKEVQTEFSIQPPSVNQDILSFSQDYPANFDELSDFINSCKSTVSSDIEGLKNNKGIKEIVCTIERGVIRIALNGKIRSVGAYIPSFSSLDSSTPDSIVSFKSGKYLGISVDLKGVVREYDPSLLGEEKLYFCSISEPSWTDPFYLQMEPKQDLIFDEGDVSCGGVKMEGTHTIYFSGFIPQAESLNIKQYLVDEQTVSEVINKQSFPEIKEILKDYPIIWQMEKLIIP